MTTPSKMNAPVGVDGSTAADPATFANYLGQASWLMTLSPEHKELPISTIDKRILPAIFLKQFRLFAKGKQPIAFLTWAKVSDEIKAELEAGRVELDLKGWRSGPHLVVVDCISPFGPAEKIKAEFLKSMGVEP